MYSKVLTLPLLLLGWSSPSPASAPCLLDLPLQIQTFQACPSLVHRHRLREHRVHRERENARARVGVDANGAGGTQTAQQANTDKNACGELLANCDGGVKTAR